MMSIRFLFPLLDADGYRPFSFNPSDDHYRREVLYYTVFSPFLFRSVMIAGWAVLVGGSGQDVHLLAGSIVQVSSLSFPAYYTPSRFRITQNSLL